MLEGAGLRLRAACGRNGLSAHKTEGDGATPLGVLPLSRILFRADRCETPHCAVPVEPIAPNDGWCDDPADPAYNRQIRLPYAARHETLWRDDGLYDVVGVLGWNREPVIPGRGSAIFLHVATPDYAPTAGCIALPLPELRRILAAGLTAIRVVV
ncbi:MAG TPA: L,D-transpeptidase family protein [Acidocella sp.]|uniref:L,D-transpeptidase family protein n=1 Tax=Acidocella sp. TaxID=50710 RepID=UPI002BBCA75A|nr:L,D-transpeptidase family protein [Acidocella sp.]HVE21524.1 L,D-transpeptidase family protein [Acidocella sp.]